MPGGELSDVGGGWREAEARLRRGNVAPLLGDAAKAGGVARRRNRDRHFTLAQENVMGGQAPIVRGAGLQVAEQPAGREGPLSDANLPVDVPALRGRRVSAAPSI